MKFYKLGPGSAMIVKVMDSRAAEFKYKTGWDAEVNKFKSDVQILRGLDTDMYTEGRLRYYFPRMQEITEEDYINISKVIDSFNAANNLAMEEIKRTPLDEVKSFIVTFPANYPDLINYRQLNNLWHSIYLSREPTVDINGAGTSYFSEDAQIEDIRALYSILKNVEKTQDTTLVRSILNQVETTLRPERRKFIKKEENSYER